MKRFICSFLLIFSVYNVHSDPIQDLSINTYQSGWFPNYYKGKGPMTCPQTCEVWVGGPREHEYSNDIDGQTKENSLCKITDRDEIILKGINDPKSHWLYGNQFDDWPMCHSLPIGVEPIRKETFMCLCFKSSACTEPDLIVSQINRPEWDSANHRSIVKVEVSNIGTSNAGGFYTRLTDPGTGSTSVVFLSSLGAGASTTVVFYFNYWVYDPDAELNAEVDTYNQINECKEDNNKKTFFELG